MPSPKSPAQTQGIKPDAEGLAKITFDAICEPQMTADKKWMDDLSASLKNHANAQPQYDYVEGQWNYIFINDGSRDHASAQRYGHFPELSIEQNRVIWEAREKGWDVFYVECRAIESAQETAYKTFLGATQFLKGAK